MTQNMEILNHLKAGKSITPSFAVHHFRCYRLAARIYDLRRDGWDIVATKVKRRSKRTGKIVQFAEYSLLTDHGGK